MEGSLIECSRGVGYFLVRNIRACLCLHIVGRENVKGFWDEAFDGKARQAWREDIAPWESWSSQPPTTFWRDAKAEVYVPNTRLESRLPRQIQ